MMFYNRWLYEQFPLFAERFIFHVDFSHTIQYSLEIKIFKVVAVVVVVVRGTYVEHWQSSRSCVIMDA